MSSDLFSGVQSLQNVVDFHVKRHSVLASNLANASTPDYEVRDLVFSEEFQKAKQIQQTNSNHIQATPFSSGEVEVTRTPARSEKAGVRLERAMAKIAANKLRYEASLEIVDRRMGLLKYAATNGGM